MTTVDLITGFLGAGKTTFLRRYAEYLKRQGLRFVIIENEFGRANVDAALLHDLNDAQCDVEQLTGACICCGGEQKFRNLLYTFSSCGYDRILVEPSGIYDADTFFRVMQSEPVCRWCRIGTVITVADAVQPEVISPETAYLMVTQLAAAGAVLLSKTQLASADAPQKAAARLKALCADAGCTLRGRIYPQCWADLTDADLAEIAAAGCHLEQYRRIDFDHSALYHAVTFPAACRSIADLQDKIKALLREQQGRIFRIKGYVTTDDGQTIEVNCTPDVLYTAPHAPRQSVLTVIGTALDEAALHTRFS